jgi:hypothetical protein
VGIPNGNDLYSFSVGQNLPESDLTSYASLGALIAKYNDTAQEQGLTKIDDTLVEIRDALAHGRVSAELTSDTLRLIKFSKASTWRCNGDVQCPTLGGLVFRTETSHCCRSYDGPLST